MLLYFIVVPVPEVRWAILWCRFRWSSWFHLFSMFRFALSGCFTELFNLRDVIESYHTDEEVAVPPECNVSRVFPA